MRRAVLLATMLIATSLAAGCTDKLSFSSASGDDDAFTVNPTSGDATTEFVVTASKALRDKALTWDFGDGTTATGETARHTYGFTNGVMTIKLIATTSDIVPAIATKTVTLGKGENAVPTGSMRANSTWTEIGRPITFTSTARDADRDPLTYLWTYTLVNAGGAAASDGHGHSHGEAATPVAGEEVLLASTSDRANATFDTAGTYDVKLRVRDPKGGELVKNATVTVSKFIPARNVETRFEGKLIAGTAGAGASEKLWIPENPAPDTYADAARHTFTIKYPASAYAFLQWTDSTNTSTADLDLELRDANTGEVVYKSEMHAVNPNNPGPPVLLPPMELVFGELNASSYVLVVRAFAGTQVSYTLDLFLALRFTPELVAATEG